MSQSLKRDRSLSTDRINQEPAVFRGLTASELKWVVLFSLAIYTPPLTILMWVMGKGFVAPGLIAGLTLVTVLISGQAMRQRKKGKPDGYHNLLMHLKLARWGLKKSPFVQRHGQWDIGRK